MPGQTSTSLFQECFGFSRNLDSHFVCDKRVRMFCSCFQFQKRGYAARKFFVVLE